MIYLDHNATTPLHPRVKRCLSESIEIFGNPNAIHKAGIRAKKEIESAREKIASYIGAKPQEIIFTSGGTESNNTVINNTIAKHQQERIDAPLHIITSGIEHASLLNTLDAAAGEWLEVSLIPPGNDGIINPDAIKSAIKKNTCLVSIQTANHETGTIQAIESIGSLARDNNIPFHTDAVQAFGKIPIKVSQPAIDYMSISAHKIYGPKGIGALYVREGVPFRPFIIGGFNNPRRGGTENTCGIIGFAEAASIMEIVQEPEEERLGKLKKQLLDGLMQIGDISINGNQDSCLSNTLNVTFHKVDGNTLVMFADNKGIALSTGPACSAGRDNPSPVLLAMGKTREEASQSVRFSMGLNTSEQDIAYTVAAISKIVAHLRNLLP